MGMSTKRSLAKRHAAIGMLHTLDSRARMCGMPFESILTEYARINAFLAGCSRETKAYVSGWQDRIRNEWYTRELIFCHVAPDGTRYTGHKNRPEWALDVDPLYKTNRGWEIATWKHAHFWPNGKPFSEPQAFQPSIVESAARQIAAKES